MTTDFMNIHINFWILIVWILNNPWKRIRYSKTEKKYINFDFDEMMKGSGLNSLKVEYTGKWILIHFSALKN